MNAKTIMIAEDVFISTDERLSEMFGCDAIVLREDLYPHLGGGNKARKMGSLSKAGVTPRSHVISCGASGSNHLRALGLWSRYNGFDMTAIMHGSDTDKTQTTSILGAIGVNMRFVKPNQIAASIAFEEIRAQESGQVPLVIEASMPDATRQYIKVGETLRRHPLLSNVSHLACAIGTGGTAAGLAMGLATTDPTTLLGVSVGRDPSAALDSVEAKLDLGLENLSCQIEQGNVPHTYGIRSSRFEATARLASQSGFGPIDPCYVGKLFEGLLDMKSSGTLEDCDTLLIVRSSSQAMDY